MSTEIWPRPSRSGREPTVPLSAPGLPPPPALAGRYELGSALGHGGVGTVYLARDLVLDRPVAVKVFRTEVSGADRSDRQAVDRFEQEARLLAGLNHPGLVAVYDAGTDASVADHPRPFLVMELVQGATLAHRLEQGPIPADRAALLGADLAVALAHVHGRGVVHRDVKPANILLAAGEDERVLSAKLTDFGIARLVDSTRMTMDGLTIGTPNYLSPEQATGGEVGPPADVYALGLVLLECLTGEVVYPGWGVEAAVVRLHRPPEVPSWLGPQWSHLVGAMTDADPGQRPSAEEAGLSLTNLAHGRSLVNPGIRDSQTQVLPGAGRVQFTRTLPARKERVQHRWRWLAALVGAAVLVAILVVANQGARPGTVRPPAYPSVPGQLGTHLQQLQKAVQP
jgi:serine/threonine protein kinase